MTSSGAPSTPTSKTRVRVFIDFWNLTLSFNDLEPAFRCDWSQLPRWLAAQGAQIAGVGDYSFEGAHVFASYNPRTDASLHRWLTTWLDRQTGVQVEVKERRRRDPPKCPSCQTSIAVCPACGHDLRGTVEKGVDSAIVTAMIRLAWEDSYDIAVLVTSDADFVPAVEFLDLRGRKVIQAGFPPLGAHLARACWGSIDLRPHMPMLRRT